MNTIDLSRAKIDEILAVVQQLVDCYRPSKVVLFGSQVWGEPDEGSDVDLFILKRTDEGFLERMRTVKRLLYETGRVPFAMDLLIYTPQEAEERLKLGDPFVRAILSEGLVLYESADTGMA